ncbi:iron-containing redox enzyme family protein [Algicola sagamiensis]|uniref:iron-containing redox enzyme family protein n=1 Tax=Algicola sagamiensis TaxID=163869 RepID=UPI00037B724E|nr:iron-containing redox enzyme family protein [Algicola sagamiensis]
METQELNLNTVIENEPRYLIPEDTYDYDHPEVIHYTDYFMQEAAKLNVFVNINATIQAHRSLIAAQTMATAWYDFAKYVPSFITKAVAMTDDPERQHHLIQIAYDELGGQDKNFIHSNLFLEAIEKTSVPLIHISSSSSIKDVLNWLDKTLTETKTQSGIVGLLLSFEIIAEENIETLFNGLCYTDKCDEILSKTPFFKIHRADETEHIRHSVANFLRFCQTEKDRQDFKASFDMGVEYWQRFWDQIARLINLEVDAQKSA